MFSLDDIFSDRFATQHRLCIAVAGPGHDFLNRHTCGDAPGFMIRTSLLKVGAMEGDGSSWHACKDRGPRNQDRQSTATIRPLP